ncbi:MAG: EF-hand domain-containing protein [Chromatiaceae bacterium]|nr:MAG: EF-hand domain-containing protein [Chromatiaceae bacterium]
MQRTLPLTLAALGASLVLSAANAQAPGEPDQPPGDPAAAFIQQLDTDGDGRVSLDEALAPQQARFAEVDTDGDGYITAEEAHAAFAAQVPPEMLEAMKERGMPDPGETFIANLDQNGDGRVDLDEFKRPTIEAFQRMDADGDGFATYEEATAFFQQMRQQMEEQMRRMQEQQQDPAQ